MFQIQNIYIFSTQSGLGQGTTADQNLHVNEERTVSSLADSACGLAHSMQLSIAEFNVFAAKTLNSAMDNCIECANPQALFCDVCGLWNHPMDWISIWPFKCCDQV